MEKKKFTQTELTGILNKYKIAGGAKDIIPFGSGHINETFRVRNIQIDCPDYLLQKINGNVFHNIPDVIDNIRNVTHHLKKKLIQIPGANPDKEVLTLLKAKDGKYFVLDEEGGYWRLHYFLKHTRSYDVVTTKQQAFQGGKAFGKFQAYLADLPVKKIHEVIPDFHNIDHRINQFKSALSQDLAGRKDKISREIDFVIEREVEMRTIIKLGNEGKIPLRITHNDTKFNNVLLDKNDSAQCVIDLDTVMPGYVAYDFGDAVRTIINSAPEDEPNLENIQLNVPLFEAFTEGFINETSEFLTDNEVLTLGHGVFLLPFIMGVRFLTDYLNGDIYYKTSFAEHNIQRSRAQFELVRKLEQNRKKITEIIYNSYEVKEI